MPYVPKIGAMEPRILEFSHQFTASILDGPSFMTSPIELLSNDGKENVISHATGFYWNRNSRKYLITNWHVVTGKNPFTRENINRHGFIPERIAFYGMRWEGKQGSDLSAAIRDRIVISLFDDKGKPKWIQHKNFETQNIDIVAIPVEKKDAFSDHALEGFQEQQILHLVGADCAVVGYPLNSYAGWLVPIWKRGSLATEPLIPVDSRPLFLLDVASTEGMSGSPIFRRIFGPAAMRDNTIKMDNIRLTEFVGVYAGRLMSTELANLNLGYGWYGNLVDEIVGG